MNPFSGLARRDTHTPSKTSWRPWTLRTPYFVAFSVLCMLLSMSIELIIRGCSATGCHVFGEMSTKELSFHTNLAYSMIPTALSLALGLLWALPHHDMMRLEPYFQMSVPGGANAADSLFLGYSYTFSPLIPFKAGKNRHYIVLLSSFNLLLMDFFVTPLISGAFNDIILEKPKKVTAVRRSLFQDSSITHSTSIFSYTAYTYTWLNGSLPGFTASNFSLLPVVNATNTIKETWSANTILYGVDLDCNTSKVISLEEYNLYLNITTDYGVKLNNICDYHLDNTRYCDSNTTFLTPWSSIIRNTKTSGTDIGTGSNFRPFIIAWARGVDPTEEYTTTSPPPRNITALSCTTSHYSQPVAATFEGSSGKVISVEPNGLRQPFFNNGGFYQSISPNGPPYEPKYKDSAGSMVGLGFTPPRFPKSNSHLQRLLGPCPERIPGDLGGTAYEKSLSSVYIAPGDSLTAYALRDQIPETLVELLDPDSLADAYRSAFQLLFAFWVSGEMVNTETGEPVPATILVRTKGFEINNLWARAAQSSLLVVAVIAAALGVLVRQRYCELDGEPNSLAESLRLLSGSPDLTQLMENAEFSQLEDLLPVLNDCGRRYKLQLTPMKGPIIKVATLPLDESSQDTRCVTVSAQSEDRTPWEGRVWQLRTFTGIGFVFGFGVVLALLVTAFAYAREHNGLPTFSAPDSFGYKVLFSYLPIAISMSMKPVLVTLGACHCMFGPYKALKRQNSLAQESISIDYDKSPPDFQLLRSLRTGDIALAALTLAILLSNVVSVTLSGLFLPGILESSIETLVNTTRQIRINKTFSQPAQEMSYILTSQLTRGLPSRPWTTPEYYILPFSPIPHNVSNITATTFGIGVEINCELIPADHTTMTYLIGGNSKEFKEAAWDDASFYLGTEISCGANRNVTMDWSTVVMDKLVYFSDCPNTFFTMWGERVPNPHPNNASSPYQNKIGGVILKCTSQDKIVELEASISQDLNVNSTSEIRKLPQEEIEKLYANSSNITSSLSTSFLEAVIDGIDAEEIGSNSTLMWFNHLLVAMDPAITQNLTNLTHIPNPSYLPQTFEKVYKYLFAINMGLYANDIISIDLMPGAPAGGTMEKAVVNMDNVMFKISAAIVSFYVAVLVVLYSLYTPKDPGHPPVTLLAVYASLYASNAKEDCAGLVGSNPGERAQRLEELKERYSYGRFMVGGKNHVGVYQELTEGDQASGSSESNRLLNVVTPDE